MAQNFNIKKKLKAEGTIFILGRSRIHNKKNYQG